MDYAGNARRQLRGWPDPGNAVVLRQDRSVAADLGSGPEASDVRQQPYRHEAPPSRRPPACADLRATMRPLLLSIGISVNPGLCQANQIAPSATRKAGVVATHQHIG